MSLVYPAAVHIFLLIAPFVELKYLTGLFQFSDLDAFNRTICGIEIHLWLDLERGVINF